jgi:hypothetical protein
MAEIKVCDGINAVIDVTRGDGYQTGVRPGTKTHDLTELIPAAWIVDQFLDKGYGANQTTHHLCDACQKRLLEKWLEPAGFPRFTSRRQQYRATLERIGE